MTQPTKAEKEYAFNNPFLCPCCRLRFPSKELREEHWKENEICDEYQFEGKCLLQGIGMNGRFEHLRKWEENNPFKKFNEAL